MLEDTHIFTKQQTFCYTTIALKQSGNKTPQVKKQMTTLQLTVFF